MECDMGWEIHPPSRIQTGKIPPLTLPIKLGQKIITALIDTGSSVSLVRAYLIPASQPVVRYADVAGVYRNFCRWPVVRVPLTYNNNTYSVEVLKVNNLPFPALLGRDAPAF